MKYGPTDIARVVVGYASDRPQSGRGTGALCEIPVRVVLGTNGRQDSGGYRIATSERLAGLAIFSCQV